MSKKESIRDLLLLNNEQCEEMFESFDQLVSLLLNDNGNLTYRHASELQIIQAFNYTAEVNKYSSSGLVPSDDKLERPFRLFIYDKGKVPGLLNNFLWTKKAILTDLLLSLQEALSGKRIITAIVLVRPILEHIGIMSLFSKEIDPIFHNPKPSKEEIPPILVELAEIINKRGKGTRVDWETYLKKSLRVGNKKSYKHEEGTVDLTANDLMNGIDNLNKKVKGVRKVYELASEFAHPNVGSHFILLNSAVSVELEDGIRLWKRDYDRKLPVQGINLFKPRLIEVIEILIETVEYFQQMKADIELRQKITEKWAKEAVKFLLKKQPFIFQKREPCPCFSGVAVGKCCGKRLKKYIKI
jgi:hypothetical protein